MGRNRSWAEKFRSYVMQSCPGLVNKVGLLSVVKSNRIVLTFLARIARERPRATTCVDAAKRAVNFLRALAGAKPVNKDPCIGLLAWSVTTAARMTQRKHRNKIYTQIRAHLTGENSPASPSLPSGIRTCDR